MVIFVLRSIDLESINRMLELKFSKVSFWKYIVNLILTGDNVWDDFRQLWRLDQLLIIIVRS